MKMTNLGTGQFKKMVRCDFHHYFRLRRINIHSKPGGKNI